MALTDEEIQALAAQGKSREEIKAAMQAASSGVGKETTQSIDPQENPSFFSMDTIKGSGQALAKGTAGLVDMANMVTNPSVAMAQRAIDPKDYGPNGIPLTASQITKEYIGDPTPTAPGQETLYDGLELLPGVLAAGGSPLEQGANLVTQTLGGQAADAVGLPKVAGQIVGGLGLSGVEAAIGKAGTGAIGKAEKLEAGTEGITSQFARSSNRQHFDVTNPITQQVDNPIMNAFRIVTEDGGYAGINQSPEQRILQWNARQDQIMSITNPMVQQADAILAPQGLVYANLSRTQKLINGFRDEAEKSAATQYIGEQANRIDSMNLEGMLAEKRAIYKEYSRTYGRAENSNTPAWKTEVDMSIARDLKDTVEQQVGRALGPDKGAAIADLNARWGAYEELRPTMAQASAKGFTGDQESLIKDPNLYGDFKRAVFNSGVKQAIASGYRGLAAVNAGALSGGPALRVTGIEALQSLLGNEPTDPNLDPSAPQLSRDWNKVQTDPSQGKAFAQRALGMGIQNVQSMPDEIQKNIFAQVLGSGDPTIEPAPGNLASAYKDNGSWKINPKAPTGLQDRDMLIQKASQMDSPADRANVMTNLWKNGKIVGINDNSSYQQTAQQVSPQPQSDPLEALSSMGNVIPFPQQTQSLQPSQSLTEAEDMLSKMLAAKEQHGW